MEKIYSKIDGRVLHFVNRLSDIQSKRNNLCSDESFIQCASYRVNKGLITKPHEHIERKVVHDHYVTQEAWIVIQGSIKVILFDIDGQFLSSEILYKGDVCITFFGGHTFDVLENNTIIYEFKTGPYIEELDKKLI